MMSLLLYMYTFYVPLVDNSPNSTERKGQFVLRRVKLFFIALNHYTVYENFNQTQIYIVGV